VPPDGGVNVARTRPCVVPSVVRVRNALPSTEPSSCTFSPFAAAPRLPVTVKGRPLMFSIGAAVTRTARRRRSATDRRRLLAIPPSAVATLTRRLLVMRSGSSASKRPLRSDFSVTSGTHAPFSSRSTTTGTAAAGAMRPETSARWPWVTAGGA
jgi:hypothetical protein